MPTRSSNENVRLTKDADPAIAAMVDWVAPKNGGSGAVRSLAEFILHAQGKWDALVKARYVQGKI